MASSGQYWSTFKLVFIAIWHVSSNIWIYLNAETRNIMWCINMHAKKLFYITFRILKNVTFICCVLKIWISRCAWFNIKLACTIFVKIICRCMSVILLQLWSVLSWEQYCLPYINLKWVSYNQCSISVIPQKWSKNFKGL